MYNVYKRIQMNIEPLKGNCQNPVRCVGSRILSPNRASGIITLGPFRSKLSPPTKLCGPERTATSLASGPYNTGVTATPQLSISLSYAAWRVANIGEQTSASGTLLRQICVYLVLLSLTDSHPFLEKIDNSRVGRPLRLAMLTYTLKTRRRYGSLGY